MSTPLSPDLELRSSLHAAGLRLTPQRVQVLNILEESDEHLNAETIWQRAHARDKSLNLATVYRTLAVFKEMGLVEQRYFAREHKREYFELAGKREHYHFTCLGCGEVIEVETPRVHQAVRELSESMGLRFAHACVCFEGYCAACVEASSTDGEDDTL